MSLLYLRMRNLAAVLMLLSGLAQTAAPWLLPVSSGLLLTALCGSGYLLLALGLMGTGRLTLLLAALLPTLRAWFSWWPLPMHEAELLRVGIDVILPLLCIPVLWHCLHPDYEARSPGLPGSEEETRA